MRVLVLLLVPLLAACSMPCGAVPVQTVQAASPCAAPVAVQAQPTSYAITPMSYARATLAIPGELVGCVGNFLKCSVNALFSAPVPEAQYAPAFLVQSQAAPCAAPVVAPQAVSEECVRSQSVETYTEMVPVQRQRRVITPSTIRTWREVIPGTPYVEECAPAPQAAPQFSPCAPPLGAPPAGPAPTGCLVPEHDPCANGACCPPSYTAAR